MLLVLENTVHLAATQDSSKAVATAGGRGNKCHRGQMKTI